MNAHRPEVNLTTAERIGRVSIGLVAVAAAILLLLSAAGNVVAIALLALLAAAGLDLVATGALGHCPLYKRLGYTPPSLRSRHNGT